MISCWMTCRDLENFSNAPLCFIIRSKVRALFVVLSSGRHHLLHLRNPWHSPRWVRSQTVYKLSSKEKKISAEPGFEPRAAGWEARMLVRLCYKALQSHGTHRICWWHRRGLWGNTVATSGSRPSSWPCLPTDPRRRPTRRWRRRSC